MGMGTKRHRLKKENERLMKALVETNSWITSCLEVGGIAPPYRQGARRRRMYNEEAMVRGEQK